MYMCIEYVEHYVKQTRTLDIQPYRAKSNSTLDLKWVQWVAQKYSIDYEVINKVTMKRESVSRRD